jgi:hypothetical protein
MLRSTLRATALVAASAAALAATALPAAAATSGFNYARIAVMRSGHSCANLKVDAINDKGVLAGTVYCAQRSRGFIAGHSTTFAFPAGPHSDTLVTAISDDGTVVGESQIDYAGRGTAWLRTPAGKYRKINNPTAGQYGTWPQGINKNNVIVGGYYVGTGSSSRIRGYMDRGGHFTDVTLPSTVHAAEWAVDGINDRGDLCGWYTKATGPFHGFVIIGGRFHTVDAPAAGRARGQGTEVTTIAYNRSYAGTLVYAAQPDFNHQYRAYKHAFVVRDGRFTSIAVPSTWGNNTNVTAMSNAGTLVGAFIHRDGNGWDVEGFRARPKR